MGKEIVAALEKADADESIRVIIITGAGRGFCGGLEIVPLPEGAKLPDQGGMWSEEEQKARLLRPADAWPLTDAIQRLKKPTICALNGVAAGAGAAIALYCDIIVASDQSRFRIAFTRIGLPPEFNITYLLQERIGRHRALELCYTNDIIDAEEMYRIGLLNIVVPHDELMKKAREMAEKMFAIPPVTLALTKQCVRLSESNAIKEQIPFDNMVRKVIADTEDRKEARASYMEKREPVYQWK